MQTLKELNRLFSEHRIVLDTDVLVNCEVFRRVYWENIPGGREYQLRQLWRVYCDSAGYKEFGNCFEGLGEKIAKGLEDWLVNGRDHNSILICKGETFRSLTDQSFDRALEAA